MALSVFLNWVMLMTGGSCVVEGKSVHEAFHEVRQPAGQAPPPGALAGLARVRSSWTKLWMIAL
jgi:hypothetical protein